VVDLSQDGVGFVHGYRPDIVTDLPVIFPAAHTYAFKIVEMVAVKNIMRRLTLLPGQQPQIFLPSMTRSLGSSGPAAASRVGKMSIFIAGSLQTLPAGIFIGHVFLSAWLSNV
jgi:hypothetical protein